MSFYHIIFADIKLSMTPLTDKIYLLEKFSGKGGWTFVRLPEISPGQNTTFGWVKVCGTIDRYEIKNYNLQPMGNGRLFYQ